MWHVSTAHLTLPKTFRALSQVIRYRECLLLQGTPFFGFAFGAVQSHAGRLTDAALLCSGSYLLVAGIFLLNDVVDLRNDSVDPKKGKQTDRLYKAGPEQACRFALLLCCLGLMALLALSGKPWVFGLGVFATGLLYSSPLAYLKATPLWSSALHFSGGILHFMAGYATATPVDVRGWLVGAFFTVIFVAGHLIQEIRDYDADRQTDVHTNAVSFGKKRMFFVSTALFTCCLLYLAGLSILGLVPPSLHVVPLLACTQLWAARSAWRQQLGYQSTITYQAFYRKLYLLLGSGILLALLHETWLS